MGRMMSGFSEWAEKWDEMTSKFVPPMPCRFTVSEDRVVSGESTFLEAMCPVCWTKKLISQDERYCTPCTPRVTKEAVGLKMRLVSAYQWPPRRLKDFVASDTVEIVAFNGERMEYLVTRNGDMGRLYPFKPWQLFEDFEATTTKTP